MPIILRVVPLLQLYLDSIHGTYTDIFCSTCTPISVIPYITVTNSASTHRISFLETRAPSSFHAHYTYLDIFTGSLYIGTRPGPDSAACSAREGCISLNQAILQLNHPYVSQEAEQVSNKPNAPWPPSTG